MKISLLTLLLLTSIHFIGFSQSDSLVLKSSKPLRTHRSNLKTQAFIVLPKWDFQLTYEYALSKKTSLGVYAKYFSGKISLDPEKVITLAPFFNYYFSAYKKINSTVGFTAKSLCLFSIEK